MTGLNDTRLPVHPDPESPYAEAVREVLATGPSVEEVELRVFRAWQQRRSAQMELPAEPTAEEVVARIARGEVTQANYLLQGTRTGQLVNTSPSIEEVDRPGSWWATCREYGD
jgi:hypothetical protein